MKKQYDLKKLKKRLGKVKVDQSSAKIPISLRLDGSDLGAIKEEAERLGIPYQTLLSSILHQYITGQFVARRTIEILKELKVSSG